MRVRTGNTLDVPLCITFYKTSKPETNERLFQGDVQSFLITFDFYFDNLGQAGYLWVMFAGHGVAEAPPRAGPVAPALWQTWNKEKNLMNSEQSSPGFLDRMLARGVVPDFLIRMGIRSLNRARLKEEWKGDAEAQQVLEEHLVRDDHELLLGALAEPRPASRWDRQTSLECAKLGSKVTCAYMAAWHRPASPGM